ncbi:MAG: hypothetical protein PHO92_00695 [Candidatus Peribacteraceae bacterium]|nr:hypothetical protein [Candidatus Peribacteraceae bacterium]
MAKDLESQVARILQKADIPCLRGQEAAQARIVAGICSAIRSESAAALHSGKSERALLQAAEEKLGKLGGLFLSDYVSASAEQNLLDTVRHALRCTMSRAGENLAREAEEPHRGRENAPPAAVRMQWIKRGGHRRRLAVPIRFATDEGV